LPVALLVMAIIWINQFQDAAADAASGKSTWVVRLARRDDGYDFGSALWAYAALLCGTFTIIFVLAVMGWRDPTLATPAVAWALLTVPLGAWAIRRGFQWHQLWLAPDADHSRLPYALLPVNAATIGLHLFTGVILVIAYLF